MIIELKLEAGYDASMIGLSLNKEQSPAKMQHVANKLAFADSGSHRKFLRQICLWWYLKIPRYIWSEADTYKISTVRNSGSTMHNLHKKRPVAEDFHATPPQMIDMFCECWDDWQAGKLTLSEIKACLPEGYLQDSVLSMNYEVFRTMYRDRITHRLPEWQEILNSMLAQIEHPELIIKETYV